MPGSINNRGYFSYTWGPLAQATAGAAVEMSHFSDKTVQIRGTYGTATVTLQGSMDGTNWVTLTDVQGAAISFTANDNIRAIAEHPKFVRPNVAGGDGTTAITVIVGAPAH